LSDVRQAMDDTLLTLVDHLPGELQRRAELATGGKPRGPILLL